MSCHLSEFKARTVKLDKIQLNEYGHDYNLFAWAHFRRWAIHAGYESADSDAQKHA